MRMSCLSSADLLLRFGPSLVGNLEGGESRWAHTFCGVVVMIAHGMIHVVKIFVLDMTRNRFLKQVTIHDESIFRRKTIDQVNPYRMFG